MKFSVTAEQLAKRLLEQMRETPMRRGALPRSACHLKQEISLAIASRGVPHLLAERVALQFVLKFHPGDLFGAVEWHAIGDELRREIAYLKREVDMGDRRIVAALPKLSALQVVEFFNELIVEDPRIARTILHAAVNTSDPLAIGRRYLAEYRLIARHLASVDPTMARTVAAASFSAGFPLTKAMQHLERFSALLRRYQDKPRLARRLARAGFRGKWDLEI